MSNAQTNEVNYELHSLGWKAFQNLCATVVTDVWGQTVQTFFDSHDGGRDGAFSGLWESSDGASFTGSFAVQCKFTAKPDTILRLSDLKDEFKKAKRLAKKGLSDNYFLFTNAKLLGINDEEIRSKFEEIPELKECIIFGKERISQIIRESRRLRMLVPRIYGLGDLGQILDERAYDQAKEILSSLGDDLNKFIITDAYRQSAKAITEHGFVLLLGEPMCGKSTIAAALSMGALDEWGCSTIKVRDADDFVKHYNPNEKQLFWVDDAFGPTQIDWSCTASWSKTFPHVNAAIHKGAKVIFTSRDYIYKSAKKHLKESALPIMKESQVVIHVEDLKNEEKEQILYNHIKLGNQTTSYKKEIKPFLSGAANHEKFSPEIARRLGNHVFTKNMSISKYGIDTFIDKPLDLLCEIINTIDDSSKSALALVFMRGGNLPSPLGMTNDEKEAVSRLGGNLGDTIKSLDSLNESLLLNSIKDGEHYWHFKHPSIRDAFAKIVASSYDLMDIYLKGAPLDKLFSEVSCGDVGIQGVSVIVPESQYHIILKKIKSLDTSKWFNRMNLHRFLSYRCAKSFLQCYIGEFPDSINSLHVYSYIYANSNVDLLVKLNEFGLLEESIRLKCVSTIRQLAVETPDSGFLKDDIRTLISDEEFANILDHVERSLIPDLNRKIEEWKENYNGEDDPEVYFDELKDALSDYGEEFEYDESICETIGEAYSKINEIVENLKSNYSESEDEYSSQSASTSTASSDRSIFDDVDS